jgi:hypothetical protein
MLLVLWFFYHLKHEKDTDFADLSIIKWTMVILGIFAGFTTLLYVLAWIGFAVGIR